MRPPAVLNADDCWRLLASQEVARVAWSGPDGVSIVPVNYVAIDRALWFRTQPYSELGRQSTGSRVAVEVDQLDVADRSAWSVVVVGWPQAVEPADVPEAVQQMRIWIPGLRSLAVRVDPVEVTGRRVWGQRPAAR